MWIKCDASECKHNCDQYCKLHCVYIEDGRCTDYKDYFQNNPLYESLYFKRCRALSDGKKIECRVQAKGLRYVWKGLVLFTEDDIRNSIVHARFTEQITGLLISGGDMQTRDGYDEVVRKNIKSQIPVLELPWYETDKVTHKLVPHKQSLDEILAPNGVSGDLAP